MIDLLKRWVELEPERCRPGNVRACALFINGGWRSVRYDTKIMTDKTLVQCAVQQAAQARGWNWTLWFDLDEHGAYVFTDGGRYEYEAEVSAAEAILTAYLKALEENQ